MLQLHDFYNMVLKPNINYIQPQGHPPPFSNEKSRVPPVPSSFSEDPRQTQPAYSMGKLAGCEADHSPQSCVVICLHSPIRLYEVANFNFT
jgi:hypothetical protein